MKSRPPSARIASHLLPLLTITVLAALLPLTAGADVFRGSEIVFLADEESDGAYVLTARLPAVAAVREGLIWPRGCRQTDVRQTPSARSLILTYRIECAEAPPPAAFIDAPWRVDGARYTLRLGVREVEFVLRPDREGRLIIPLGDTTTAGPRPMAELISTYTWQGVLHIWFGWDHLALVLCLVMMMRGAGLLWLITTFTVGHSVSLGLAFFEVVKIAIPPVEAIIALSIVWLARDGLLNSGRRAQTHLRDYTVVLVFGVIHGLGFASALEELGVGAGERAIALAAFNVGVEAGQVTIVLALLAVLAAAARLPAMQQWVRSTALTGAGAVGAFWLLERVSGF